MVVRHGTFDAADGPLVIAVGNDDIWRRFAPLAGVDPADARFATNALRLGHLAELHKIMHAALAEHTVADWLDRLREADVRLVSLKTLDRVHQRSTCARLVCGRRSPRAGGTGCRIWAPTAWSAVAPASPPPAGEEDRPGRARPCSAWRRPISAPRRLRPRRRDRHLQLGGFGEEIDVVDIDWPARLSGPAPAGEDGDRAGMR